jgi:iron complex outermembrane receptor protein
MNLQGRNTTVRKCVNKDKNYFLTILGTILFLFIFSLTTNAQSGARFRGQVKDAQGASVSGATVSIYPRSRFAEKLTTTTNTNGEYVFERLATGSYLIEVEAKGFARVKAKEITIANNQEIKQDITLEVAGVSENVVVTASSTAQSVDEISKEINVVNAQEINNRDEYLIADSIRTVPGLRVQQLGGAGRVVSIKTRGLRNADTAVLIDGIRFRDSSSINGDATSFLTDFVVTNIDRIEVLRGSGSSLYGTNAIGGAVNIVTDEGGGKTRGSFLFEGGSLYYLRGRAQIAGGAADNRIAYSAGVSHYNVARGIDGHDAARNTSGQGRILFRIRPTMTLSARLYASDSFVQLNNSPDTVATLPTGIINAVALKGNEFNRFVNGTAVNQLNVGSATFIPDANDPDNSSNANFFTGTLVFTHRPFEKFGYTISYQGLRTERNNINGSLGVGFQPFGGTSRSNFGGRIQTLNVRTDFQIGDVNTVTAGYEYEHETFINDSLAPNNTRSKVDVVQKSNTIFVQDQMRFMQNRLQASVAFRFQSFNLERPQFAPTSTLYNLPTFPSPPNAYTGDGSIAYFFAKTNTKLRAHIGNGYRVPSLFERFGTSFSTFGNSFTAFGDPQLKPERSIAFDSGVDQMLFADRLRVSVTYFYTRLQEVIDFRFPASSIGTTTRPFGGYTNVGGGLSRGVEASATATPLRSLDFFASYTYANSDARNAQVGNIISAFVIPEHQFTFVATQRIGSRFMVNFDFLATSNYLAPVFSSTTFATRIYRFDGARKADLGASYTLPVKEKFNLRFFGRIENLFDYEFYENGFRTIGATGKGGVVIQF